MLFRDKIEFVYFLFVLILTSYLTWLFSPKDHQVEFEQINKTFNEIKEEMKQLKHDITTLSQPVDISTYTDQLSSIKESVATHSERLSLLETQSYSVQHHPVEQKGTVYTRTELDNLLDEIKNSLNKRIQDIRDQCVNDIQNQYNGYEDKIYELRRTYNSKISSTNEKVENIIYYMYNIAIPIFLVQLLINCCCFCCVHARFN